MDSVLQDLRYAARSLARTPGTTLAALFILGIGIGTNGALFSAVDALLFRPPPGVTDSEGLVRLHAGIAAGNRLAGTAGSPISFPQYERLREGSAYLAGLAAYANREVTIGSGENTSRHPGVVATSSYFDVLGVRPHLGRFFTVDEEGPPGSAPTVVIGHDYWLAALGGDAGVIGRTLVVNGTALTVVGVAPAGFRGVDLGAPDLWLPVSVAATPEFIGSHALTGRVFWLQLIGRLAPGFSREEAQAATIPEANESSLPGIGGPPQPGVILRPLTTSFGAAQQGRSPVPLWTLGISAALLLLASTTVANLLLSRAARRGKEVAVRIALGASRLRLVRLMLTESLLISAVAGIAGLFFAAWSAPVIQLLPVPPIDDLVDGRTIAFSIALSLVVAVVAGLAPALWATREDLNSLIKQGSLGAGIRRSRIHGTLVVAQIAISLVLLVAAGIFLKSFRNIKAVDPGVALERIAVVSFDPSGQSQQDGPVLREQALESLRALRFVDGVTTGRIVPFTFYSTAGVRLPGRAGESATLPAHDDVVGRGYFETLGITLTRGRVFTAEEESSASSVAIVNETLAKAVWPNSDPVGACLEVSSRTPGPCLRVVGVVADARTEELLGTAPPAFYRPASSGANGTIFVRTEGDPASHIEEIRRELQALDPGLAAISVRPMTELIRPQLIPWEVASSLFLVFGGLALILAITGLYVVMAFTVSHRTHELGIRSALGASAAALRGMIVRYAIRLAGAGVVLGLSVSLFLTRIFAARMYGISHYDPSTYLLAGTVFVMVAVCASLLPARRATRVDPMVALRSE